MVSACVCIHACNTRRNRLGSFLLEGLLIGSFEHGLLDDDDKVSYGVFKVQHLLQKSNNTRSFKTLISKSNIINGNS